MRVPWARDSKDVMEAINMVIDTATPLFLQSKGSPVRHTRAQKIHIHKGIQYLIMKRPSQLQYSKQIDSAIFKMKGLPLLGFQIRITKETDKLIGASFPKEIYSIDLRQHPRHASPDGSLASFLVGSRPRVSLCKLLDISQGGLKLIGSPIYELNENDIIGPCTLSLAGTNRLISREVTLQKARITRVLSQGRDNRIELGINFELSEREGELLREYISYIDENSALSFPC